MRFEENYQTCINLAYKSVEHDEILERHDQMLTVFRENEKKSKKKEQSSWFGRFTNVISDGVSKVFSAAGNVLSKFFMILIDLALAWILNFGN